MIFLAAISAALATCERATADITRTENAAGYTLAEDHPQQVGEAVGEVAIFRSVDGTYLDVYLLLLAAAATTRPTAAPVGQCLAMMEDNQLHVANSYRVRVLAPHSPAPHGETAPAPAPGIAPTTGAQQ
jgi:hypothetical protein